LKVEHFLGPDGICAEPCANIQNWWPDTRNKEFLAPRPFVIPFAHSIGIRENSFGIIARPTLYPNHTWDCIETNLILLLTVLFVAEGFAH
jgi:hypothetical protein